MLRKGDKMRRLNVLLVEEDAPLRTMLEIILEKEGCAVTSKRSYDFDLVKSYDLYLLSHNVRGNFITGSIWLKSYKDRIPKDQRVLIDDGWDDVEGYKLRKPFTITPLMRIIEDYRLQVLE